MRSWTHAEEEALRNLGPRLGGVECARAFDRSHQSIKDKAHRLGICLGKKDFATQVRLPGEAVLRRIRELSEAILCPGCGYHFVGVKSTGLCGRCHMERLKIVHEEEIGKIEAQQALWSSRSRLYRLRQASAPEPELVENGR